MEQILFRSLHRLCGWSIAQFYFDINPSKKNKLSTFYMQTIFYVYSCCLSKCLLVLRYQSSMHWDVLVRVMVVSDSSRRQEMGRNPTVRSTILLSTFESIHIISIQAYDSPISWKMWENIAGLHKVFIVSIVITTNTISWVHRTQDCHRSLCKCDCTQQFGHCSIDSQGSN